MNPVLPGLPAFQEREQVRQGSAFKNFIYTWNHGVYNKKTQVGSLMEAAKNFRTQYPEGTLEDWHRYYLTNVRTTHQVTGLVQHMAFKENLDYKTALTYWTIHILDSAYVGVRGEQRLLKEIQAWLDANGKPYFARFATDKEDREGGIDIIVENCLGDVMAAFQAKRTAYFYSTRPTVVESRTGYNKQKYAAFKKKHGVEVWYVDVQRLEAGEPLTKCWFPTSSIKS